MKIYSVFDDEFRPYGRVVSGFADAQLLSAMSAVPMPSQGTAYELAIPALEACDVYAWFRDSAFGGMPVQLGMCWGYNTRLNCLEYHRDSEFNLGTEDFVLLLARLDEMSEHKLDTAKVKAFRVPAGALVEVYSTTLHYAPCHTDARAGFRVLVALPKGTNTAKPDIPAPEGEDRLMTARNKWLLAHEDSAEAAQGAYVGLYGENIDIAALIR